MIGQIKSREQNILLDRAGVDKVAEIISVKLEKAGVGKKDVLRVRLLMEEQLVKVAKETVRKPPKIWKKDEECDIIVM